MASTVIHMCVAKEINKVLKRNDSKLLIGSIAPDIGKLVNIGKILPHFSTKENEDIPVFDYFLDKYQKYLDDDFVLGYYIHLYTDYLWFKYFMSEIINKNVVKKLDGTIIRFDNSNDIFTKFVYNDYTNLNINLFKEYDLDLSIFYDELPKMDYIIDEIPMDKLDILLKRSVEIINNSKLNKDYIFNTKHVSKFINMCVDIILGDLKEKKLI